mmetsp:Transcript_7607/g.11521  ORF Transcript_7607/g.11521 Transcript_7607/m.11521 type:complete len:102 (+) Transcript_7607:78-383(+)
MNASGFMGNSKMTKREEKEVQDMMQDMMFQEMQDMYISLIDRCFSKCVNNFRSRKVQSAEKECLSNCVAKSIAHNQRVQMRFAEQNQMMNAQVMNPQGGLK